MSTQQPSSSRDSGVQSRRHLKNTPKHMKVSDCHQRLPLVYVCVANVWMSAGLLTRDEMVQVCRQFGIKENVATMYLPDTQAALPLISFTPVCLVAALPVREYDRLATEHGIDYMEFILHLTPYVDPARVAPPGRGKRRQSSHVMED